MGGASSLGKSTPSVSTVEYEDIPTKEDEAEAESDAVRDEETNKIKSKNGISSTILTSPLGTTGATSTVSSGLLGHV
ncbi:MAG: hypothetical protein R3Y11_03880 [Pseudomonadota bacterium]